MRHLFLIGRILLIAVTVFTLASCAYTRNEKVPVPLNQDCHNWCHNGWCTKHCDYDD